MKVEEEKRSSTAQPAAAAEAEAKAAKESTQSTSKLNELLKAHKARDWAERRRFNRSIRWLEKEPGRLHNLDGEPEIKLVNVNIMKPRLDEALELRQSTMNVLQAKVRGLVESLDDRSMLDREDEWKSHFDDSCMIISSMASLLLIPMKADTVFEQNTKSPVHRSFHFQARC